MVAVTVAFLAVQYDDAEVVHLLEFKVLPVKVFLDIAKVGLGSREVFEGCCNYFVFRLAIKKYLMEPNFVVRDELIGIHVLGEPLSRVASGLRELFSLRSPWIPD